MTPNPGGKPILVNLARPIDRSTDCPHVELLVRQVLSRTRMAVIFGGDKSADGAVIRQSRNPRSWKSYESVALDIAASLRRLGCQDVLVLPDDMRLASRLSAERIHIAWLNTGGAQGHSAISHAPAMLEMLGIPYVGHDPLTAAALDNKFFFKRQLIAIGIPTAPFVIWHPSSSPADPTRERKFATAFRGWDGGYIVKPITGRASLHVHYVESATELAGKVRDVFAATQNHVLIEAYLSGREYCIAVSGPIVAEQERMKRLSRPFAFAGVERVLTAGEHVFTSMDVRPITKERVRPLDPLEDSLTIDTLEDIAATLFAEFPLKTLVRLDVRADHTGRLYVLEANPKPDLKAPQGQATSLICAGLERYGMGYDDLILSILANRVAELLDDEDGITAALDRLLAR